MKRGAQGFGFQPVVVRLFRGTRLEIRDRNKGVGPSGIPSFADALDDTEHLFKSLMLEKHLTEALD